MSVQSFIYTMDFKLVKSSFGAFASSSVKTVKDWFGGLSSHFSQEEIPFSGAFGGKRRHPPPNFVVTHYDRRYNERLRIKAIEGNRRALFRLKGKTDVFWRGHQIVLEYPIFNEVEFSSYLRSVNSFKDLRDKAVLKMQSTPLIDYFMLPYSVRKDGPHIVNIDGNVATYKVGDVYEVIDLIPLVPLERQYATFDYKSFDRSHATSQFSCFSIFYYVLSLLFSFYVSVKDWLATPVATPGGVVSDFFSDFKREFGRIPSQSEYHSFVRFYDGGGRRYRTWRNMRFGYASAQVTVVPTIILSLVIIVGSLLHPYFGAISAWVYPGGAISLPGYFVALFSLGFVVLSNTLMFTYIGQTEPLIILASAAMEEVHKRMFGMYLPAAEIVPRLMTAYQNKDWLVAFCALAAFYMHILALFLPLPAGVLFHAGWNYFVYNYLEDIFVALGWMQRNQVWEHPVLFNPNPIFLIPFQEGWGIGLRPPTWTEPMDFYLNMLGHYPDNFEFWNFANRAVQRGEFTRWLFVQRFSHLAGAFSLEDVAATVYHQHMLDISKMMQLLRFIVQEQYDHALHALVNFGYADSLRRFLQLDGGPEDVMNYFFKMFSTQTDDMSYLAHTPLRSFMEKFLPAFIRKSPTYVAIVTLVSCIMSSSLFSSWSIFYEFLPLVDFSKLSVGDMISTAIESGFLIVKSAIAAFKSGNFREFFRRPKEYVMRVRIMECLDKKPKSADDDKALSLEIDALVEEIFLLGDVYLMREIDKLTKKRKEFSENEIRLRGCKTLARLKSGEEVEAMEFDELVNSLMMINEHRTISDLHVARATNVCGREAQTVLREAAVILGILRVAGPIDDARVDTILEKLSFVGESRMIVEIESARQKAVVVEGEKSLAIKVSRWMTKECKTLNEYSDLIDEISESFDKLISHPQLLVRAKDIRDDLIKRRNACFKRQPPIVIFLLGNPGTGKTTAMSQITKLWCKQAGVEYDPAIEGYLYTDQKHPAETISQDGQILFLNDVTAEHSQDDKSDKVSLGEVFRSIMDSTPLVFPSAQVMRKGMNFWNVKLAFVTTNTRSFVFSEDAERLKRRFDEYAIVVDYEICDKGVPVEHAVYSRWDTVKRNENTMVKLYTATCKGKILSFSDCVTRKFEHVSFLYSYLYKRFQMEPVLASRGKKMLANTCNCGVLKASHFRDGVFVPIVEDVCEPCEIGDVVTLPVLCKCGLEMFHRPNPVYDCGAKFTAGVVEVACYATFLFIIWTHFERLWNHAAHVLQSISSTAEDVAISAKEVRSSVLLLFGLGDRMQHVADLAYYRFVRNIKKFLFLVAGSLGFYALVKMLLRDSSQYTHKIIVRENTDASSLKVDSHRFEVNWPQDTAMRWGKEQQDMKVVTLSKVGVGLVDLENKLKTSRVPVTFYRKTDPSKASKGFALVIGPEMCLMNRHYFYDENGDDFEPRYVEFEGVRALIDQSCIQEVYHDGLKTDVLVVRSPKVSMRSDLLSFFASAITSSQSYGKVIGVTDRVLVSFRRGDNVGLPLVEGMTWQISNRGLNGECGSPLMVETPKGWFVAGIVSFGSPDRQGGNLIYLSDLVTAIERFDTPVVTKAVMSFTLSETLSNIGELDPKAEIRNVVTPYCEPIGTAPGGTMKFHSSMARTDLYDHSASRWSKVYDYPRKVRSVIEGRFVSAFTNTMSGIVAHGVIAPALLYRSVDVFLDYFWSGVIARIPDLRLSPASLEESLFGCRELRMDRSNFNSSLGPEDRHWKTRKDLFNLQGEVYVADPLFVGKIDEYIQQLKLGVMRVMHVSGSFKDEIRSLEKLEMMWVRLFCTIDHPSNIVSRMYLQPLVQLLLDYPELSKCFGKMNSGSVEWDRLYHYLSKGEKWCDMDFKNFDISHMQEVIRAVARFFYKLAIRAYRDEEAALVCYCLVMSLCVQIFQFMNDYMLKVKGLPSGHILTLILNSIVNILLMMCAYQESGHDVETFFSCVFPAVVGDDNLSGLSSEVASTFNLAVVQPIYKRYGYTVTDAKKSQNVEPFVSKESAQFLKRGFRYEPELDQYVAPIDMDSIWKMLAFWTKKSGGDGVKTYVDRMVATIDVAQRELFLHGRIIFETERDALRLRVEELGWNAKWYEWSDLLELYKSGDQFMFWA